MTDSGRFPTSLIAHCSPQIPESVKKCLLREKTNIKDIDNDYAYFTSGGKMKIGRAILKHCGDYTPSDKILIGDPLSDYNSWKNKIVHWTSVPKAINEALRRADILDEDYHLQGIAGVYPSKIRDDIEYVISRTPDDIFKKSSGQSWGRRNCERVGGEYGKPRRWLEHGEDCGFCSDIEHGNAILYARYKGDGEWIGRQMLRWCVVDNKGTIGLGVEKRWYGEQLIDILHQEKDELIREISEKKGLPINFHKCVTPYIFAGYSDVIGGGNMQIEYDSYDIEQNPLIERMKEILPSHLEHIAEYGGGEVWLYSMDDDEDKITDIGQRYTEDDSVPAPDEVAHIIIDMENYQFATTSLLEIKDALTKAMIDAVEPRNFGDGTIVFNNQEVGQKLAYKIIHSWEEFQDFVNIDEAERMLDLGTYKRFVSVGENIIKSIYSRRISGLSAGKEGDPLLAIRHIDRRRPINKMRTGQSALDIKRLDNLQYYDLKSIATALDRYYDSGYDGATLRDKYETGDDDIVLMLKELDEEYNIDVNKIGADYLIDYLKLFPEDA